MTLSDKDKALQLCISAIEKAHGKGSIFTQASEELDNQVDIIPTGSINLDRATGIGGYPRGRIVEIFGSPSSGKSTLTLHAIAECQKLGGTAAYIDSEFSIALDYADALGVQVDKLLISQPATGEVALDIVEMLARSRVLDLVVVDSVAALVPSVEVEGAMGDQQMGLHARLMSKAMRKLAGVLYQSNTCLIMTNQNRQKIGAMAFTPQSTQTGGNALPFYASIRLDIARTGTVESGSGEEKEKTANSTRVKVVKNKLAPPYREAEFEIEFGKGINKEKELVQLAVDAGIITKAVAWYALDGKNIGQGMEATLEFFKENIEIFDKIKLKINEI